MNEAFWVECCVFLAYLESGASDSQKGRVFSPVKGDIFEYQTHGGVSIQQKQIFFGTKHNKKKSHSIIPDNIPPQDEITKICLSATR